MATRDTFAYYQVVYDMLHGVAPLLDERTIGYPLFLFFLELIGSSPLKVIFIQCLISLAASMYYVHLISKHLKTEKWAFMAGIIIFYASPQSVCSDTYLMPTSLFTSFIILTVAFLVKALYTDSPRAFSYFSLASAIVILIRPQGLFILPLLVLLFLYLLWNKKRKSMLYAIGVPITVILLANCTYNYFTLGKFTLTDFAAMNNLGSSIYMLETDPGFPKEVNELIEETNKRIPVKNLFTIRNSTKYSELKNSFSFWDEAWPFKASLEKIYTGKNHWKVSDIMNRIGTNAKKKHPLLYLKFVCTNLVLYYDNFSQSYFFYYNELTSRNFYWGSGEYLLGYDYILNLTWKDMLPYPKGTTSFSVADEIKRDGFNAYFKNEPFLIRLNHYWEIVFNKIFVNVLWVFGYFAALVVYIINCIRLKRIDELSVFVISLFLYVLLNSALIMLIQYPFQRFSYPLTFIYYSFTFVAIQQLANYFYSLYVKRNN